ncbi:NAD(P)/FAD-dependent oxidoreductase [candidate division KSB1 bacterium]|nr:NAD(P)/FAD-dependent oxidoreductase [candidate division KSB1 bacterium]
MINSKVIIVGGGPAGSTCAWKLRQQGIDCLILDKQPFPRTKLCAGWITPGVLDDLAITPDQYPHGLDKFNTFCVHIYNKELKIKVHQYAIRRYEFDDWLLKRSGVTVYPHEVKTIIRDERDYILDDQFRCRYLVGAGGTHCPVYRTFFRQVNPRVKDLMVVTLEKELRYDYQDVNCHLWFLQNKLPGYAWYVPKGEGYLNIGIGGYFEKLKSNGDNIKNHWLLFIQELERLSLVKNFQFKQKGYTYYIRNGVENVQIDNAFIIGDAVGLATQDMGEGIGPAVESGILAANAIISGKSLDLKPVRKYSFPWYLTALRFWVSCLFS